MRTGFDFSDAVKLLGGRQHPIVQVLDKIADGVLLAGPLVGHPGTLGLFEAKDALLKGCQELLTRFPGGLRVARRRDRTEQIQAAHAIVIITSFFEALDDLDVPVDTAAFEFSAEEQLILTTGLRGSPEFTRQLLSDAIPALDVARPTEVVRQELESYYTLAAGRTQVFVTGLAVWDQLSETERTRVKTQMGSSLIKLALARYGHRFRELSETVPEFGLWADRLDGQATRRQIGENAQALARLEEMLKPLTARATIGPLRVAMERHARAELDRPIAESGDTPDGLHIPKLAEAYVEPCFRVLDRTPGQNLALESSWDDLAVADDIDRFLAAYLTSARATRAPLIVLGHPGSGKSLLTKVLAARLPAGGFLPIRVALRDRDIAHATSVQAQIEQAVAAATGEHAGWAEISRAADRALPVIILDGFDELLQATGVRQSDYLSRIQDFQQREAAQEREVAVIVTSRVAVADRAVPPPETLALRIEPFAADQIRAWALRWNAANAGFYAEAGGRRPFDAEDAIAQGELAAQPLLLLLLALYHAGGPVANGTGTGTGARLDRSDLYDGLLRRFAQREVVKGGALTGEEVKAAVDGEMDHLMIAAFAMFNRSRQWVTRAELDDDLSCFNTPPPTTTATDFRTPLTAAETAIGRFYFIHQAQAVRDGDALETYEFLHSTFGEYLMARRIVDELLLLVEYERAAQRSPYGRQALNGTRLYTLLSFAPLSNRDAVIGFLQELLRKVPEDLRPLLHAILASLFRGDGTTNADPGQAGYKPVPAEPWVRYAHFNANILLLACIADEPLHASSILGDDTITDWQRQTHLWRAAMQPEDWTGFVHSLHIERVWAESGRDLLIRISESGVQSEKLDRNWLADRRPGGSALVTSRPSETRHRSLFHCNYDLDIAWTLIDPLVETFDETTLWLWALGEDLTLDSGTAALLELMLWHPEAQNREILIQAHRRYQEIANHEPPMDSIAAYTRRDELYLARLARDAPILGSAFVWRALDFYIARRTIWNDGKVGRAFTRCVLDLLKEALDGATGAPYIGLLTNNPVRLTALTDEELLELLTHAAELNSAATLELRTYIVEDRDLAEIARENPRLFARAQRAIEASFRVGLDLPQPE